MQPLPDSLEQDVRSAAHFSRIKKHAHLVYEGEVCRSAWYLQKGLVRCYYHRDDREVITWFLEEGQVVLLSNSLFEQKKSVANVQALEDCALYSIRFEDILRLLELYAEAPRIHMLVMEQYNHLQDMRIRATSMLAAADRYKYFLTHFPHLLNRVKLEHIAAYLDISKSSLARARRG